MGWKYLSISKHQRLHCWILEMDKSNNYRHTFCQPVNPRDVYFCCFCSVSFGTALISMYQISTDLVVPWLIISHPTRHCFRHPCAENGPLTFEAISTGIDWLYGVAKPYDPLSEVKNRFICLYVCTQTYNIQRYGQPRRAFSMMEIGFLRRRIWILVSSEEYNSILNHRPVLGHNQQ